MTWQEFECKHFPAHNGVTGTFGGGCNPMVQCECGGYWIGDGPNAENGREYTRQGKPVAEAVPA